MSMLTSLESIAANQVLQTTAIQELTAEVKLLRLAAERMAPPPAAATAEHGTPTPNQ